MRIGIAVFDAGRRLRLHNARYTELLGLPADRVERGMAFDDLSALAASLDEYTGSDGELFISRRRDLDRRTPTVERRVRPNGQVIEISTDPLADGGWTVSVADISALARAEDESRRRAGMLDGLLLAIPHGICVYGPDRRVTMFNPAYAEVMRGAPLAVGDTMEEVIRRRAEAGEYGADPAASHFKTEMGHDIGRPQMRRRTRPNGMTIDVRTAPLPDGGHVSVVTDVTPLVQAEQQVAARAREMETMLANIRHGIVLWSADRRLVAANAMAAELMDLPPAFLVPGLEYDKLLDTMHALGAFGAEPEASVDLRRFKEHDRSKQLINRRRSASGSILDVRSDPTPDGGFIVTFTDVSSLARAEEDLERRAGEMEAMLANIQHGIILWSSDKRLIAFNRVAAELSGPIPGGMVPGMHFEDFVRRQYAIGLYGDDESADTYRHRLIEHDRRLPMTARRRHGADGELEIRSEPTPDGGFVVTLTDISEGRRVEAELRMAKEAAEAATVSKARFLATMSHELRTPLNAVIGFSDAILRDRGGTDPAVVRDFAEEINGAGKRLLLLINTILDVARIEAGRYDLGTDRIDFARLVPAVLRQSRNAALAAEIELINDLPEDTPLVRGDERRMQQVLGHLVSNAVKFTDPGGHARITASLDEAGDLLVQVTDTGIGIAEENIDRVFEPFTQIEGGLERRFEGTGLGLYLSRALVEAHGGTLIIRSRLGEGTTAEIRMPSRRVIHGEPARLASD